VSSYSESDTIFERKKLQKPKNKYLMNSKECNFFRLEENLEVKRLKI
jgi:hypothetical protein